MRSTCKHRQVSQYMDRQQVGWLGFNFQQGQEIFLYSIEFTLALRPFQPPKHQVLQALSAWVTQPGCEAEHSTPSSGEVKYGGAVRPLLYLFSWHSTYWITHKDNLTFIIQNLSHDIPSCDSVMNHSLSEEVQEQGLLSTYRPYCHLQLHYDILTHISQPNRQICRRFKL
jgi:hypothetical protein